MDKQGLLSKFKQKKQQPSTLKGRPGVKTSGKPGQAQKGGNPGAGRKQNGDNRESGNGKPLRKNIDFDSEDSDEMGGDSSAEDEERLVNRKAGLKEGAELDDQETTDERRIRIAKSIIADAKALRKRTREEVMDDDNMDDFFQEDGEDDVQNMTQMLQNDILAKKRLKFEHVIGTLSPRT